MATAGAMGQGVLHHVLNKRYEVRSPGGVSGWVMLDLADGGVLTATFTPGDGSDDRCEIYRISLMERS